MFRRPCSDATPHNHRILPSSQVLYVGISFLCFHLTSAIIVRKAFPLVNKSNIVSPPWKAGAEVLIQATRLSKFRPILYRIGANCLWKVLSESSACFTGIITPLCTIVRTLSSREGTFYSPALVSDILTRSRKTCHRREERRQMPESLNPLTKKSKRPPRLS